MELDGENWKEFYQENAIEFTTAKEYPDLAIGGEACLWSNSVGPETREPLVLYD